MLDTPEVLNRFPHNGGDLCCSCQRLAIDGEDCHRLQSLRQLEATYVMSVRLLHCADYIASSPSPKAT